MFVAETAVVLVLPFLHQLLHHVVPGAVTYATCALAAVSLAIKRPGPTPAAALGGLALYFCLSAAFEGHELSVVFSVVATIAQAAHFAMLLFWLRVVRSDAEAASFAEIPLVATAVASCVPARISLACPDAFLSGALVVVRCILFVVAAIALGILGEDAPPAYLTRTLAPLLYAAPILPANPATLPLALAVAVVPAVRAAEIAARNAGARPDRP